MYSDNVLWMSYNVTKEACRKQLLRACIYQGGAKAPVMMAFFYMRRIDILVVS